MTVRLTATLFVRSSTPVVADYHAFPFIVMPSPRGDHPLGVKDDALVYAFAAKASLVLAEPLRCPPAHACTADGPGDEDHEDKHGRVAPAEYRRAMARLLCRELHCPRLCGVVLPDVPRWRSGGRGCVAAVGVGRQAVPIRRGQCAHLSIVGQEVPVARRRLGRAPWPCPRPRFLVYTDAAKELPHEGGVVVVYRCSGRLLVCGRLWHIGSPLPHST